MAKKRPGAPRKYKNAKQLEMAVEKYWKSISYEQPAIISTPTGEVDENGCVKYRTLMLTEDEDGRIRLDGLGKPKTVTKYLQPPSVLGLCLHIGIVKSTWEEYAKTEDLGPVCARFKMRSEQYKLSRLDDPSVKTVQGIMFDLENNYGYKRNGKVEGTSDATLKIEMLGAAKGLAE